MRKIFRPETVLFLFLGIFLSLRIVTDPDLWWQLAVGRYIWEVRSIPQLDLFSFSAPNYPYVYHTWLADIFLYLSYSRWGLWGVSLLYALILGIGVWFLAKITLISRLSPRPSFKRANALDVVEDLALNKSLAFYKWSLLFFVPFIAWIVEARAQIFTFVGLTILYYIFNLGRSKLRHYKKFIPVLFTLWVNLHGGFILGLGFLLLLIVLRGIERKKDFLSLLIIFILSCFVSLLNPYGLKAFKQSFLIGTNTFNMQHNLDWAPLFSPVFPSLFSTTLLVGKFVYALFLFVLLSGKRTTWQEKVLLVLFFFLTLRTRKYMLALLVVLIPAVVVQLEHWREKIGKITLPAYLAIFAAAVTLFGNAALVVWKIQRSTQSEQFYAKLPAPLFVYPYAAVNYMKENGVPERMLNDIAWGGYLIWHFPGERFFIDGRMDNFYIDEKPFTLDYWQMINLKPGWRELMDEYKINAVFGPPNWPLIGVLREYLDWDVVYEDKKSVIFKRSI